MMELVDMRDLGSRVAIRWGSSPHARTTLSTCASYVFQKHRLYIITSIAHIN